MTDRNKVKPEINDRKLHSEMKKAFDSVRAGEDLKTSTKNRVFEQMRAEKEAEEKKHGAVIHRNRKRRIAGIPAGVLAAAMALIIVFAGAAEYYTSPASAVTLDGAATVTLQISRQEKVLSASCNNSEANEILKTISLKGMNCQTAVETLLSDERIAAYITDDGTVNMAVTGSGIAASELQTDLQQGSCGHYEFSCSHISEEQVEEAESLGIYYGRLEIYKQLKNAGIDITPEEVNSTPMKDLREMAGISSGNGHGGESSHSSSQGSGTGSNSGGNSGSSGSGGNGGSGSGNGSGSGSGSASGNGAGQGLHNGTGEQHGKNH